jgi:DNA-binding PadR family transcriptional regulator
VKRSPRTKDEPVLPTLSRKEALVLELLLGKPASEMYGLELVAGSNNALKRGTVYVTLSRMEEKGYIESHLESLQRPTSGLPRRLYRVTGYGLKVYKLWGRALELGRLRMAELGGAW